MNVDKRQRTNIDSDDNDSECEMICKNRRVDTVGNRIMKLEKCNVRRARKIKLLKNKMGELEKAVSELNQRVNFLESVATDYENENRYFREQYYS